MGQPNITFNIDKNACQVYEKVELTIRPEADGSVVSVDYTVTAGSNTVFSGKGFVYRECKVNPNTGKIEAVDTVDSWKIRYSATEQGEQTIRIEVRTADGETHTASFDIAVNGVKGKGHIRPHAKRQYFDFENGEPYFAIGLNAINIQYDFIKLGEHFKSLAANGCNHVRLWLSSYESYLINRTDSSVNHAHAWGYDYLMNIAEEHGIYVKLCFDHVRRFVGVEEENWSDFESTYSYKKGGPCKDEADFFTNKEAIEKFKREHVDHIVSRWGYSTHVFAWELWNENDTVRKANREAIVAWSDEISKYIKQLDGGRHMVTNSTGSYVFWKELWELESIDIAQMHGYWKPNNATVDNAKDICNFIEEYYTPLKMINKPRLFAEYGLVNHNWGHNNMQYADQEGIVVHDGAWCALALGSAGTGMFWWANQLTRMSLEWVFKGISAFVKDIDFTSEDFRDVRAFCNNGDASVAVRGQTGNTTTILWVKNKSYSWWNAATSNEIARVRHARVDVYDLPDGAYTVQVWDTVKGVVTDEYEQASTNGALVLRFETLVRDCAVKLIKR